MDEDFPPERGRPDPNKFIQADGKVVTDDTAKKGDTSIDEETGEIRSVRSDPDVKKHTVGVKRAAKSRQTSLAIRA